MDKSFKKRKRGDVSVLRTALAEEADAARQRSDLSDATSKFLISKFNGPWHKILVSDS